MAVVTETIGTIGRDHSTITLWEANLDDDPTYDAADDALGECYDDSAFDEDVDINGGATIGLASITLSVASAERHDGTAGTGVRITRTSFGAIIVLFGVSNVDTLTVEWLEIERTSATFTRAIEAAALQANDTRIIRNNLTHDFENAGASIFAIFQPGNNAFYSVLNNIVYNIKYTAANVSFATGISSGAGNVASETYNNTIFNVTNSNAGNSGNPVGFAHDDDADFTFKNNISMDTVTAGSGSPIDFTSVISATSSHNLSSDTSASGTGSLTEKASGDQFVSTTGGSEDMHLKSGADAIDVGTDIGTTPANVNIDINGRDRDAEADTWDIGAHELVAGVAPTINLVMAPYTPT